MAYLLFIQTSPEHCTLKEEPGTCLSENLTFTMYVPGSCGVKVTLHTPSSASSQLISTLLGPSIDNPNPPYPVNKNKVK